MSKIGVLGGIGPEASSEFYSKLIKRLQEKNLIKSNKDFPQIIINSINAPELIGKITDSNIEPYVNGLKELDNLKADFIVLVCNTIHLYYDFLQDKINTPILDLRREVKDFLINNNIKSAFIVGTPGTIKEKLYEFPGITCLKPNEEEMNTLSETIFNYNKGLEKDKQIEIVKKICNKYIEKGAKKVILGCTEFALMLQNSDLPTINTLDILVEATIREFCNKSLVNIYKAGGLK